MLEVNVKGTDRVKKGTYFYVVKKTDPNLENVDVGDQIRFVEELDGKKPVSAPPTAKMLENIPSGTTIKYKDDDRNVFWAPKIGEMIVYLHKIKTEKDFVLSWWNRLLAVPMPSEDKDEFFYNALSAKKDKVPSLLRRIAKSPMNNPKIPDESQTFLEHLLEFKKKGETDFPKLTALLTDPDLYAKKKEGHKLKDLVEQNQRGASARPATPPARRAGKLYKARSRLYWSRILRSNIR